MRIERLGKTELRYIRNNGSSYSILGSYDELDRREREFHEIEDESRAVAASVLNVAPLVQSNFQPQPPMLLADVPPMQISDSEPLRVPVMNFSGPEPLVYPEQPAVPFVVPAVPMLNCVAEEPLPVPVINFDSPVQRRREVVQAGTVLNHYLTKNSGVGTAVGDDSQPLPRPGW